MQKGDIGLPAPLEDYTKAAGVNTRILKIEFVVRLGHDIWGDEENLLGDLMNYGSAAIVDDFLSPMTYDEAAKTLCKRSTSRH